MYKFIQQITNSRQWVDILLCLPIQSMIINNYSQLSSLLPNEDDWSIPWAAEWFDSSLSQIFIHLPSHLCGFSCQHSILTSVVRLSIGEKLNVMHSTFIHRHAWWIKDIMEFLNQFVPSRRDLDASRSSCLTVTNHLPGDKFTVRLQQHQPSFFHKIPL